LADFNKIIGDFLIKSEYVGCLALDEEGTILFVNKTFRGLLKSFKDDLVGRNFKDIFHEKNDLKAECVLNCLFNDRKSLQQEWRFLDKSGMEVYLDVEAKVVDHEGNRFALGIFTDKTNERNLKVQLEQKTKALEYTNNQRELAIKTAKLGIWKLNLATGTNTWNDELLEMYELTREEWEADLEGWQKMVFEEDAMHANEELARAFAGEYVYDVRFRIRTKSGKVKHLYASAAPFFDEEGKVTEVHGVNIDVTNLTEAERESSVRKEQIENITNKVPGVVLQYYVNADGTDGLTYLSEGVKKVYGVEQHEAFENVNLIWDKVLPEDLLQMSESIQKSAKELVDWDHVFRAKDVHGNLKYLRGMGTPHKKEDGQIVWDTLTLDITEQVKQQQEIQEKSQQLQNFTDQLPGVALRYFLKPDGSDGLLFLSKGVEDIYEINRDDALKDVSIMWQQIHEEDLPEMIESIQHSANTLTNWESVHRIITPSGKTKYLSSVGTPSKMDNGTIVWDTISMDITDQKEKETAVAENQQLLDKLTNEVPGIVYIYNLHPDGSDSFGYLSKGIEEIFEIDQKKAIENTQVVWNLIYEDDLASMVKSIQESAETLNRWSVVYRIKTTSGVTKIMQGSGVPTKLLDGTIRWYSISLDITKQVEQQKMLEEKSRQLQSITDQIPGVVLRYQVFEDGTDSILYISDGVEELYGVTKEVAYKDSGILWAHMVEEDIPELKDSIMRSATTMEPWEHIYRYYNKDYEIGYLQGYGTPHKMEDGSVIWDAITMDITKRMEAELEANRSNSKLRSFIKSSPIAIYQIEPNGYVTDFWNPAAEQIYGWTRSEVLGKTLPHLSEENKKEFATIIEDIRISKKPKQFQVKRQNRYNEQLTLEITAGPLFDEHEKLTDLLIIANDITELEEYRKTLEGALREKEILLQEIHHRVKNNLAIISGLLELQALKDDNEHNMSLIIEARNRIHSIAMVHEQLYQDMDFSHINPSEYYRKLLSKLQANTTPIECDIEYDLKFDIDRININRAVPLGLLINELFTNSIKHAFNNGKGKLKLHFTQIDNQIRVYYEDDGPGFEIEDVKTKNTIGWQLIETLLLQLDSEYTMDTDGRFMLDFVFTEVMQGSQSHFR